MRMKQYSIGLDFGSLSGRAVLLDLETAEEVATSVTEYAHSVMSESLPNGKPLAPNWALQHPLDYIDVLRTTIPDLLAKAGVSAEQIVGIGVDFTASTVLPVTEDGTPLCLFPAFADEPNAYVKLWKHHAAQPYADRLNTVADAFDPSMLALFGGRVSSEWLIPKAMETLDLAPSVYETMAYFVEAADWIVWKLCGNLVRNACLAGYKSLWNKRKGFPPEAFFEQLDPRMKTFIHDKLSGPVLPSGMLAGYLTAESAELTGLLPGTPVSVAGADAHSAVPGCGVSETGHMLIVMGTSACHMLMGNTEIAVPGICGVVEDGMLPGFISFEAGQSCFGDHFEWFEKNCLPLSVIEEAKENDVAPLTLLSEKAQLLHPGESGLLALDFWNGNRSVLDNGDLSGLLIGMTLDTKPEEIYRALVESLAFGTRVIIDRFRESGVEIHTISACGGIPHKNPFLMQVFADVLGLPIQVVPTLQAGARGSAIFGAAAAGVVSLEEAVQRLGSVGSDTMFVPNEDYKSTYDALYEEYRKLYFYFGTPENDVMLKLKQLRK